MNNKVLLDNRSFTYLLIIKMIDISNRLVIIKFKGIRTLKGVFSKNSKKENLIFKEIYLILGIFINLILEFKLSKARIWY